jgi:type 2 lantibiotic biosynthesis protein LanM
MAALDEMQRSDNAPQHDRSEVAFSFPPISESLRRHGLTGCLHVVAPLIDNARRQVRQGLQTLANMYSHVPFDPGTVEAHLAGNIAERLLTMMARTLVLELNVARLDGLLVGDTPGERFENYSTRLRQPAVASQLFSEYPVLRDQIVKFLDTWAAFGLEFMEHLCVDWSDLHNALFPAHPGHLVGLTVGAGDTHCHGRSVIIASFAGGERIVYKPRSLAVDGHFQELLVWLNDRGAQPAFRLLKHLDRGSHGWSKFISADACQTVDEVTRFYRRQGAYLAILYALEASDFHCDNLIAAGEHPVLVDLEALFHPRFRAPLSTDAEDVTGGILSHSVLRVGLLPCYTTGEDKAVDISGLGNAAGQLTRHPMACWECANTDEMRLVRKRMLITGAENRPSLNGAHVDLLDHTSSIVDGFDSMYRLILRHRVELTAFLDRFASDEVRVIVRATQSYAALLHESFHPDVLRSEVERVGFFNRLDSNPGAWLGQLVPAERKDLLNCDIPYFTTRPSSREILTSSHESIPSVLDESGLATVQRRISTLSEEDLERQSWLIRASLATLSSHAGMSLHLDCSRSVCSGKVAASPQQLLAAARSVGDRLAELSFGPRDRATWIGLVPSGEREWRLDPLGLDLYNGLPGVILFFAYLGAALADERYSGLARSALRTLHRQMKDSHGAVSVGAFTGLGGIIYCLVHLGILWRDPSCLSQADQLRDQIPDLLREDKHLDIIGGAAGTILALHALHRHQPSDRTLAVARACGEHLLECSIKTEYGIGWLGNFNAPYPLTGFAHGNAGIAYALLKVAALTGMDRFTHAALEAFAYERSLFSSEHANWPDLRISNSAPQFVNAWCHGAPGIGLSRLCSLSHVDGRQLVAEIDAALSTTLAKGFGSGHTLCHGDLGNADILLHAAQVLHQPRWRLHANKVAAHAIETAAQTGWNCGNPLGIESPGLMTGIAGIGYALLRLADPDRVPSVLALEPPRLQ